MGGYLPMGQAERDAQLAALGLSSAEELFADIPPQLRTKHLHLPQGLSEPEVGDLLRAMAEENKVFSAIFRGAGAYWHYIPAVVKSVASKESFLTAYTPYQPELSQGILQAMFEYQTMMCELTGMEVSNASVYDGAAAAAEGVAMCRERGRTRVLVSEAANPMVRQTIATYCRGAGVQVTPVPARGGVTDLQALCALLGDDVACLYLEQLAFSGQIEDVSAFAEAVHAAGAKLVLGVNPIAAALLQDARTCGADVAVGEGQPLGLPLSMGGPYLGFMATGAALGRRLPGRIVGETVDADGQRAFVLTLQAREQHIRREKASSNVCSNQALCALTAAAYLAVLGPDGLRETARRCHDKAVYLAEGLARAGLPRAHGGAFFHEFVTVCSPEKAAALLAAMERRGILGGLPVPEGLLWCATERCSRAQMDAVIAAAEEVCHEAAV